MQLDLLKENIAARIKSANGRRLHYKNKAFAIFISTAMLAAITTILLALRLEAVWTERIRVTALIITTLITVLNSYNAFFNHKDLWLANNTALNRLYELKFDIEYFEQGAAPLDMTKTDGFKQRYQIILDELNHAWTKSRVDSL